jgi:hypothetical protein
MDSWWARAKRGATSGPSSSENSLEDAEDVLSDVYNVLTLDDPHVDEALRMIERHQNGLCRERGQTYSEKNMLIDALFDASAKLETQAAELAALRKVAIAVRNHRDGAAFASETFDVLNEYERVTAKDPPR